jgi:hypothetical protein
MLKPEAGLMGVDQRPGLAFGHDVMQSREEAWDAREHVIRIQDPVAEGFNVFTGILRRGVAQ